MCAGFYLKTKCTPSASPPNPGGEESPFPYFRGRIGWGNYLKLSKCLMKVLKLNT